MVTDVVLTNTTEVTVVETQAETDILVVTTEPEVHSVEVLENDTIIVSEESEVQIIEVGNVVQTDVEVIITTEESEAQLLTVGEQGPQGPPGPQGATGPQGPPGTTEEDMPYAKKIDFVGDNVIYTGKATVGTAVSASEWQISKTTFETDDDVTVEWADGNANFDNIWNNRYSYSYS